MQSINNFFIPPFFNDNVLLNSYVEGYMTFMTHFSLIKIMKIVNSAMYVKMALEN